MRRTSCSFFPPWMGQGPECSWPFLPGFHGSSKPKAVRTPKRGRLRNVDVSVFVYGHGFLLVFPPLDDTGGDAISPQADHTIDKPSGRL